MDFPLQELLLQLSESKIQMKQLDEEIEKLNNEKNKRNSLIEENSNLKTILQIHKDYIINYKKQIDILKQKLKEKEDEIFKLKKENNNDKKDKKEKINQNINLINSIQDLQKVLNIELLNENNDNDSNIKNVIIDLASNSGGSSDELIYLISLFCIN